MTQGKLVVVFVVEYVEQVSIEGMNIFNFREVLKCIDQFLRDGVLAELYFAHIE